ncbi:DUF6731 family protein [Sporosarcina sp. FA9]|uniref:DUF6731 family protein n=1 Tax=Sporosarcina sp. FA9 TaxID=3413030 RepID=UPI003F65A47F
MSVTKRVGFNFFKPYTKVEGEDPIVINLARLFEEVRKRYLEARTEGLDQEYKHVYRFNDEPARLANVSIDYDTQFYHLVFERLDYVLPNRTTLHGESKAVELEDDEYIGHDVSVLYDPENHILMIQRNRSSLGPTAIEGCLRTLLQQFEVADSFEMALITDNSAKRRALNQSSYRKIQLKVTGSKADGIIERLWGKAPSGLDVVEISLSSGLKKVDEIDNEFSKEILEEFVNDDEVTSLRIRSREDDESTVEAIDLIDHKFQCFAGFKIDDDRQINPISVFDRMVYLYSNEENGMRNKILRV